MKKAIFLLLPVLLISGSPASEKSFHQKHPLAEYSQADVKSGKVPGKSLSHLESYARIELNTPDANLIRVMNKTYKDFGLPEKLPGNPKLLDFLRYSADHYRTAYLHLGKKADSRNLNFLFMANALKDLWIYHGNENARKKYVLIMKHALRNIEKLSDREVKGRIDETGLLNLWHPLMKSAAYYYAELYEATGSEHYAKRACLILERFGEVFGKWKLHFRKGGKGSKNYGKITLDKTPPEYLRYGLWGYWGDVHDLVHSQPLLDAYTLVKNSGSFRKLTPGKRSVIVDGLLHKIIKKHLYFRFHPLHNQSMNRIYGMIRFGKYLNKPEYIHIAVRWMNEMLHLGYRRDGFWYEGTEGYAYGVTKGLFKAACQLKGWSDPRGFKDPVSGKHFNDFNPEKEFGYNFRMIKDAFRKLTLPDGRSIALEDSTWDSKKFRFSKPPVEAKPFLMGASGVGMLGFGRNKNQVRLYFHWDDSAGHDHQDMLGIALWAGNREICSETGYRGVHKWNVSTAAHNTVMINETDQPGWANTDCIVKDKDDRVCMYPNYRFGDLWNGSRSRYDDLGQLMLWDVSEKDVQVASVDGQKAFKKSDGIRKYQRTLVLVRTGGNDFYIVDVFMVTGGKKHDWMLHGNLAENYEIKLVDQNGKKLKLRRKRGRIGELLANLKYTKNSRNNIIAQFGDDGKTVLRSIICSPAKAKIFVAEGPSIRLRGEPSSWSKPGVDPAKIKSGAKSEFLAVRETGAASVFVAVHEAFRNKPLVENVKLVKMNRLVKLNIKLANREDVIELREKQIKYSGNGKTIIFGGNNISGKVFTVTSMDRGDRENSFTVSGNLQGVVGSGEVIIIIDGDGRRHSYVIKKIEKAGNNRSKVVTEGETGMIIRKKLMIMTYYPSWDIAGQLTYEIPGKTVLK